jgi:acyl dehydratase
VWDVAIGQSTLVTQRVIANLFYRGLLLRRSPVIGDTLRTSTEVVGLRQATPREGQAARGLAALRIRTIDQEDRDVLDFWRCAMLPLRDSAGRTGHADTFAEIPEHLGREALSAAIDDWCLRHLRLSGEEAPSDLRKGMRWSVDRGDVVSAAPELARLTLNIAAVHHDAETHPSGRRRLVYGGHTIGIAAAQAVRALPRLATILGWHGCDHLGPVFEGDTLRSELVVERVEPVAGGSLVDLRSLVHAHRPEGARWLSSIGASWLWRYDIDGDAKGSL